MWKKVIRTTEWDSAWVCDKCYKVSNWKELGWKKDNINKFYCDRCRQMIEENEK